MSQPSGRHSTRTRVVPEGITACLFDLDGVLTDTAALHRSAWKHVFDAFLRKRERERFRPFSEADYFDHVDGRARADGVRALIASRGIKLPEGDREDPPTADTVHGLGNRKNKLLLANIRKRGVQPYPGSVRYVKAVVNAGLDVGVVTSSENGAAVLEAAGLDEFVRARIDGLVIAREQLRGKPEPDSFLAGARALGVRPTGAAVFEDALAGVRAGNAGGFGWVVGVDRDNHADALGAQGAHLVVADLADILTMDV